MKKCFVLLVLALFAAGLFPGGAQARLPQTYKEFKARYQQEARTPEGALKMHFEAIFSYINEATRAEASKMLRYSMHYPQPLERSGNAAVFLERMRDTNANFVFRSFCKGALPENDYRMSPENFTLEIVGRRNSDGYLKLLLKSSGADSARAVWMYAHDGLWYTENNAALYAMVREPKQFWDKRKNLHDADHDTEAAHPAGAGRYIRDDGTKPQAHDADFDTLPARIPDLTAPPAQ